MNEERFIGGLQSANLGGRMMGYGSRGYSVYITDKRIIGSRKGALGAVFRAEAFIALPGKGGSFVSPTAAKNFSAEEGEKILKDLDNPKVKDIEINKADISEMVLKKPGWFSTGKLIIKTAAKDYTIWVYGKKEFAQLKELLSEFHPSALNAPE
jgi:hypothetical protein